MNKGQDQVNILDVYTVPVFDETLHNLEDHRTVCNRVLEP